jgi:aconitate hydratase
MVTQLLRKKKVVGKFVEFFGPGIGTLPLPDRATIANMAPEYGATIGFFPVDDETLAYLRFTGRPRAVVELCEAYCKEQGLFWTAAAPEPIFSETIELDLADVEPALAGPKRPQDRVALGDMKRTFRHALHGMLERAIGTVDKGAIGSWLALSAATGDIGQLAASASVSEGDFAFRVHHGSVVIAAITSCTNTSNPAVMLAAGLLAKKAVERGLSVKPWVKTSLAPGSKVVSDYLREAGLFPYLEALGFHLVGYGCTTCIGNSGPLPDPIADAVRDADLVVAAVLSGNRNFEGRINPHVRMNFLASPPLVVAFALRGDVDADLYSEPLGTDRNGEPVYLKDIWPTNAEVRDAVARSVKPEQFHRQYEAVFEGPPEWRSLGIPKGKTFAWESDSTYVRRPPFFDGFGKEPEPLRDIRQARVLALLGDSVTTDHISPAGSIAKNGPAARYLMEHGVAVKDFNSYGARRGNHEVMMRGTFANIRLRNQLVTEEGGVTLHLPDGAKTSIYDAAMAYKKEGTPLVVIAGAEYGTGSSRDWAAKGTKLLGVRAVLAKSFERIHRSNLVGMGVLPLEFDAGQDAASLGLTGRETFDIDGVAEGLSPAKRLTVRATRADGSSQTFQVTARADTPNEVDYYQHGGILQFVLRQLLSS